jgi:hypothetical protein
MADPMSVAGLVMGGVKLAAQLFSSAVMTYTTIPQVQRVGTSFNTLYWLFRTQESRFLIWAKI